ncbi:MAG: hypothetical protein JWO38_6284 [Gemmataceae bacterium]|nr:hypothetical protein [Gemmataceae bacterium]
MTKSVEKKPVDPLTTGKPWLRAGISRTLFFRLKSAGLAPEPINIGLSLARPIYRISDIDKWIASRKADRRVRIPNTRAGHEAAPTAAAEPAPTTQT